MFSQVSIKHQHKPIKSEPTDDVTQLIFRALMLTLWQENLQKILKNKNLTKLAEKCNLVKHHIDPQSLGQRRKYAFLPKWKPATTNTLKTFLQGNDLTELDSGARANILRKVSYWSWSMGRDKNGNGIGTEMVNHPDDSTTFPITGILAEALKRKWVSSKKEDVEIVYKLTKTGNQLKKVKFVKKLPVVRQQIFKVTQNLN